MARPKVVILGGGPAGLGAAYRLASRSLARVTLLERNSWVGGNSGSFDLAGLRVDYGSHRLHPGADQQVLRDIRELLGDDLLDRPRHGRILLRGRWIQFPLAPLDVALRAPPGLTFGVAADAARKVARGLARRNSIADHEETFASVLEAGLGRTICEEFYFPYARKIWGIPPDEIAVTQARRRVYANSLSKMIRKVLAALPGLGTGHETGRFLYPRQGYGQISQAYCQAAREAGAEIQIDAQVRSVETANGAVVSVQFEQNGQAHSLTADQVWSTIPITILARCLKPSAPPELLQAADSIDYRALILIYLVLEQDRFDEYDAYYFPELHIPISRISEPKNFSNGHGSQGVTVLCAELPCAPDGPEWNRSDDELGRLVVEAMSVAGQPIRATVSKVVTRRLRHAYPIYRRGYELAFDQLDRWLGQLDGLLTFGRQGLFAHDNTDHALYMAYSAVACLDGDGHFDRQRWQAYRRIFETHVVAD